MLKSQILQYTPSTEASPRVLPTPVHVLSASVAIDTPTHLKGSKDPVRMRLMTAAEAAAATAVVVVVVLVHFFQAGPLASFLLSVFVVLRDEREDALLAVLLKLGVRAMGWVAAGCGCVWVWTAAVVVKAPIKQSMLLLCPWLSLSFRESWFVWCSRA